VLPGLPTSCANAITARGRPKQARSSSSSSASGSGFGANGRRSRRRTGRSLRHSSRRSSVDIGPTSTVLCGTSSASAGSPTTTSRGPSGGHSRTSHATCSSVVTLSSNRVPFDTRNTPTSSRATRASTSPVSSAGSSMPNADTTRAAVATASSGWLADRLRTSNLVVARASATRSATSRCAIACPTADVPTSLAPATTTIPLARDNRRPVRTSSSRSQSGGRGRQAGGANSFGGGGVSSCASGPRRRLRSRIDSPIHTSSSTGTTTLATVIT
jgi:hypothetical protein